MSPNRSRRNVLSALAAAGAVAVPLAGCSSGGSGDGSPTAGGQATAGGNAGQDGSGDGTQWTKTNTVEMTNELKFVPKRAQVSTGTTVTWKNVGGIGHTVTAYEDEIPEGATYFASGGFDSQQAAEDGYSNESKGNIPAGESYSHTFETAGTYKYYCIPHELNGMVGYVKVV